MSKQLPANIVESCGKYYDLTDPCINCSHAFECTEEGKTKAASYPQMGTLNLRMCVRCGKLQEWKLKPGKQGFLHSVDHDKRE